MGIPEVSSGAEWAEDRVGEESGDLGTTPLPKAGTGEGADTTRSICIPVKTVTGV